MTRVGLAGSYNAQFCRVTRPLPIRSLGPTLWRLVIFLLPGVTLLVPAGAWARQLAETDRIRLAAFEELVTVLVPMDTTAPPVHCVSIRAEPQFDGPLPDGGTDPSPALLTRIRALTPRILPISACPEGDAEDARAAEPYAVLYSVGLPTQSGSTMSVPVGYRTRGRSGGGWICRAGLRRGSWVVEECLPTWIS